MAGDLDPGAEGDALADGEAGAAAGLAGDQALVEDQDVIGEGARASAGDEGW